MNCDGEKSGEYRVAGPPGCGKTTWLSRQITNAAQKHGSDEVFVSSFTKTAAVELVSRNLPIANSSVGTLHSHCYRAIGDPVIAELHIDDFNKDFPQFALSGSGNKPRMDEAAVDTATGDAESDQLFSQYNINRNKMIPRDQWSPKVQQFAGAWDDFKSTNGLMDFTDLVETAYYDFKTAPNNPSIGFIDECQDLTPLQFALVRKWGKSMNYFILVGDADQCQPAGTMVAIPGGEKAIEHLDPAKDRVLSYSKTDSTVFGERTNGYSFKKERRGYKGYMYEFSVGEKKSKSTDNHIWLVKWSKLAKEGKLSCVYLMQKGEDFRVGWCQIFNSEGSFHVNTRARLEHADKLWILKVCKDKGEASIYESYYAAQYGIVLAPFRECNNSNYYSRENLDILFSMVRGEAQKKRIVQLLSDVGKDINYPFWDKTWSFKHYGGVTVQEMRAVNIIPGLMDMAIRKGKYVKWTPIESVTRTFFEGYVYSLGVEKYNTYISDGIVTHNCLFSFSGASPEPFMTPLEQGHKITLKQSYRVPVKPHALALKWIRRCRRREDVEYYPTQLTGSVNKNKGGFQNPEPVIDAAETDLAAGKTVMILASCAYQLQATIALLRKRGIPFHNPYRTSRGDWNPLLRRGGKSSSDRLLAYLEPAGPLYAGDPLGPIPRFWTPQQFALWTELCKSSGILNRGAKQALKDVLAQTKSEPLTDVEMSDLIFEHMQMDAIPEALKLDPQWLISKLLSPYRTRLDFPLKVYETHGREALVEQPKLIVGTIHSSKGGEAQSIYLYPDISLASWKAACESDIGYDSLIRQCYVGLTRCSEKLTMCSPETERHFGRL